MRLYGQLRLGAMDSESASLLGPFENHFPEVSGCKSEPLNERNNVTDVEMSCAANETEVEREWDSGSGRFRYVRK